MPDAIDRIRELQPQIEAAARAHGISPGLLAAVVFQESSGDRWALRVEQGFWRRYRDGIMRWVRGTSGRADDRWARYPDIYASSYGLCQLMLQTAAELGFRYTYPTELLDVETNLNLGAKLVARNLARYGNETRALLRYNGGGDASYPDRIASRRTALRAAGLFPTEV